MSAPFPRRGDACVLLRRLAVWRCERSSAAFQCTVRSVSRPSAEFSLFLSVLTRQASWGKWDATLGGFSVAPTVDKGKGALK